MNTIKDLPVSVCPTCGYELDAATNLVSIYDRSTTPNKGDFSLCFKCGEILVFAEDLSLHLATLDELMAADSTNHSQLSHIQQKIRKERPLG